MNFLTLSDWLELETDSSWSETKIYDRMPEIPLHLSVRLENRE